MAPVLALVGPTGLVGRSILPAAVEALNKSQISELRLLTRNSSSDKFKDVAAVKGVKVLDVSYDDAAGVEKALKGVDILVSAMGTSEGYHENKSVLVEAAGKVGVKVYVPSEFGTDHTHPAAEAIQSPMFKSKQEHHARAEALGIKVLAVYNALFPETSFSAWLRLDTSVPNPTWTIPLPARKVSFTALADLGKFVLSATLQAYEDVPDIPSRLRIYSDLLTLDEAADVWEKVTGGKVQRNHISEEEASKAYEDAKAKIAANALGLAIPLMICQGVFDYSDNSANDVLIRGPYAFEKTSLESYFKAKK